MQRLTVLTVVVGVLLAVAVVRTAAVAPTPIVSPVATPEVAVRVVPPATPVQPTTAAATPTASSSRQPLRLPTATPTLGPLLSRPGLPVKLEAQDDGLWMAAADGSWRWRAPLQVAYGEAAWAPDGSRLAVRGEDGALYLVTPRQGATKLTTVRFDRMAWARDSGGLLLVSHEPVRSSPPRSMNYQVHWVPLTGQAKLIGGGTAPYGPQPAILGWLPGDGRALVRVAERGVLVADVTVGTLVPLDGADGAAASDLSADGHWLSLFRVPETAASPRSACDGVVEVLNTVNGAGWTVLTGPCHLMGSRWSPDSLYLAYSYYNGMRVTDPPPIGVIEVASTTVRGGAVPTGTSCAYVDGWSPDGALVQFRGVICDSDAGLVAPIFLSAMGDVVGQPPAVAGYPQAFGGLGAGQRWLYGYRDVRVIAPDGTTTVLDRSDGLSGYASVAWSPLYDAVSFTRFSSVAHDWFFHVDVGRATAGGVDVPQLGTPSCPSSTTGAYLDGGTSWDFDVHGVAADGVTRSKLSRGPLLGCKWSPDGERVVFAYHATLSDGRTLDPIPIAALYSPTTSAVISLGPLDRAEVAGWSPDGRQVALLSKGRVHVFDSETGRSLVDYARLAGTARVSQVAWSRDGQFIAVAMGDRLAVHRTDTGENVLATAQLARSVAVVGWSPSGILVVGLVMTASTPGRFLLADLRLDGTPPRFFAELATTQSAVLSPDGRWVAAAQERQLVLVAVDGSGILPVIGMPENKYIDWLEWQSPTSLRFHSPSCCL